MVICDWIIWLYSKQRVKSLGILLLNHLIYKQLKPGTAEIIQWPMPH